MKIIKSIFLISLILILYSGAGNEGNLVSNDSLIELNPEYETGKVTGDYMNLTYVWIKSDQTYFISTSMYDEIYKAAPFNPLFGQILTINDTSIFIGTIIKGFELYEDQNSNQVLDMKEEIQNFIMLNASQLVINEPLSVERINENHSKFSWKIVYWDIDGFMFPMGDNITKVFIDSFNMTYTFDLTNNYSELKLDIEMGDWNAYIIDFDYNTEQEILVEEVSIQDYSLSILFGTILGSEEEIEAQSSTQNSIVKNTSLLYNNQRIFDTYFDDTYTFLESNENYTSKAVPASTESLYEDQWFQWNTPENLITWWIDFYPNISETTPIPQLANDKLLSMYRICYPVFNGKSFVHDPRYTAYFIPQTGNQPPYPTTISGSNTLTQSTTSGTTNKITTTPSFIITGSFIALISYYTIISNRKFKK